MQVFYKLKKVGTHTILAICDAEILDKTLNDGKLVFHVKKEFYKGKKVPLDQALELIASASIVNMVGTNVVKKAIQKKYVHPDATLTIGDVLHAQIVKL